MSPLFDQIEARIASYAAAYENCAQDPHLSISWAEALKTLQDLYRQLKEGTSPAEMCSKLKQRLPSLEKAREQELVHPTFDQYNEHYHYDVLDGQCRAYAELVALLEQGR